MRQMMLFHKSNSGAIARSRLKLLLVADKAYLSPGLLSRIRTIWLWFCPAMLRWILDRWICA